MFKETVGKQEELLNEGFSDEVSDNVFNATECLKFAGKFYKIVEELRVARINEKETELRIQSLMKDKNDSERMKDEEICAKQELIKQHLSDRENMKKKYDDKLECFEKDKAKYMVERQCVEQETRALKDEIRFLHINKYNMEKIIKDKERDIQKHKISDENYLSQLSKVEEQCKDVMKQCSEVVCTLAIVETNMDEAKKQHKNLKFINDHQNCLLLSYKSMLENAKKDLILSQAMATSSKSIILDDTTKEKIVWMERQLAGLKDICKQTNEELNVSREENQKLLKSLEKAHILVSKHVETIKILSDNDRAMQQEINDIRTDCERYREDLESTKMIVVKKDAILKELKNNAEEKEKALLVKTGELIENNKSLLREKEEQNSMWLLKIDEKTTEIGYLKNEVHGIQTILDETRVMLQMKTEEIETLKNNLNTKVKL
ncbi:repetitive organellar protein-like [Xenia sp. Carnegie-2017]|uniref:repetitive organellar protein-like n=1 Tax=Xenia sp. Carnegie-2017 TaxID=2897299 RepID=UPI001F036C6F|nr:repetitive organellar protein-like [Xenia sp. Carnegie-2017]